MYSAEQINDLKEITMIVKAAGDLFRNGQPEEVLPLVEIATERMEQHKELYPSAPAIFDLCLKFAEETRSLLEAKLGGTIH